MAGFGDVLRGLGSVLNPQVMQAVEQEERAKQAQAQQLGMFALQQQAADKRMGQEQAFRAQESAEARAARAAQLQQQFQFKEMELKQRHMDKLAELQQRGADAKALADAQAAARRELAEFQAGARREMLGLAASMRQPPAPSLATIADPNDPSKAIVIDARTGTRVGNAPPKPPTDRALPGPLQKSLTEAATNLDATERFVQGFKDDYAGYKLGKVGDAVNWAKRTFGDDSGQAQWWQDYELHQSQIRNQLFGSALTKVEVEAWNKSAINPGMDPGQVRQNLARREKLERTGFERLAKGAVAGGYKREQVEAFTGRPVNGSAASGGPTVGAVVDGYRFKGGDPADRNNWVKQ